MAEVAALRAAIDLLHLPSEVNRLREEPLPSGIPLVLRVAIGEDKAVAQATALTERSSEIVQEAAGFFIVQILFAPDTDSYRVLGASPSATARELRGNMALLIRWLHPDLDQGEERSVFVGRVTDAWDRLKTSERRTAYDRSRARKKQKRGPARPSQKTNGARRSAATGNPSTAKSRNITRVHQGKSGRNGLETYHFNRPGRMRRVLIALLGGMRQ